MRSYKIVKKKFFESEEKFESRLNQFSSLGWHALSISMHGVQQVVLMEKDK